MVLSSFCRAGLVKPWTFTTMSSTLMQRQCAMGLLQRQSNGGLVLVRGFKTGAKLNNNECSFLKRVKSKLISIKMMVVSAPGFRSQQGQGVVMGAAVLGLWTLAYYGSGCSAKDFQASPVLGYAKEHNSSFPYVYLGGIFTAAAITMATALQSPVLTNIIRRNVRTLGKVTTLGMVGIMVLEYRDTGSNGELGPKLLRWLALGILFGIDSAVMSIRGPPFVRLVIMWTGAALGLSTIGICAADKTFLNAGGPLGMALGVLFGGSLASLLVPPVAGSCMLPPPLWALLLLDLGLLAGYLYYYQHMDEAAANWPSHVTCDQPYCATPPEDDSVVKRSSLQL